MKICGLTRIGDAVAAAKFGADAIGVVLFSDSPRCVEPSVAREIFRSVGPFTARVAVSHTDSRRDLDAMLGLHPTAIQISYPFSIPEKNPVKVLRVVRRDSPVLPDCDAYVVDESRGSGISFDPGFARDLVARSRVPVILAGGLTVNNVREAIALVRPYAVDVASGVEKAAGIKDPALVQAFIRICREELP